MVKDDRGLSNPLACQRNEMNLKKGHSHDPDTNYLTIFGHFTVFID